MDTQSLMARKRKERDIKKLMMGGYQVEFEDKSQDNIIVGFAGPYGTVYEEGLWQLRVYLPDNYPYKSPSIGFLNKMFHPNVDFQFGK
jgi:ubiquitin-conjugating enzyme E2 H